MPGTAERLATHVAWRGAVARLSWWHALLRLPGVRRAEGLRPELSLIERLLPVLRLPVLSAERLLPVLCLIEPGLAVLARGILALGILSLLCILGLLGKRSLLTWM
jgi:hypothetical protein